MNLSVPLPCAMKKGSIDCVENGIHEYDLNMEKYSCYMRSSFCKMSLYVLEMPLYLPRRLTTRVVSEERWSKPLAPLPKISKFPTFIVFELPPNGAIGTTVLEFLFHSRLVLVNIRIVDEDVVIDATLSVMMIMGSFMRCLLAVVMSFMKTVLVQSL